MSCCREPLELDTTGPLSPIHQVPPSSSPHIEQEEHVEDDAADQVHPVTDTGLQVESEVTTDEARVANDSVMDLGDDQGTTGTGPASEQAQYSVTTELTPPAPTPPTPTATPPPSQPQAPPQPEATMQPPVASTQQQAPPARATPTTQQGASAVPQPPKA